MGIIKMAWDFFQNQVLGMEWLHGLLAGILSAFVVDVETRIGGSVLFFLYDMIKIMVLLGVLILIIS